MGRRKPIHNLCLAAWLAIIGMSGGALTLHAEDEHDGLDARPVFDGTAGADDGSSASDDGTSARPGPAVVERPATPGAQLRDKEGKLLPPPNFRTASVAFESSIIEARNPKPAPVVVMKQPTPQVEIDELPTYSGGAPNPKVGYIGVDLKPDVAHPVEGEVAAANEAASAEAKVRAEPGGAGDQIRSAIDGKVASAPLPMEALQTQAAEKKHQQQEAERLKRIGRLPASFTKPKISSVQ